MVCNQCQGIEEIFNPVWVSKELAGYRKKGLNKFTRLLVDALRQEGVQGDSLLDIGGGIGAIQHALLDAGVRQVTDVDASQAYLDAAKDEVQRRGYAEKATFHHGNFVDIAPQISPADIVTLNRVVCCYPDMENLVRLSVSRARKLYGLVYPRDTWWVRLAIKIQNFITRLQKKPFRGFVHPVREMDAIIMDNGFKHCFTRNTFVWQVAVYSR